MKLLKFIVLFFIIISCSNDGSSESISNGDGKGGSLAIFALKGNYLYTVDNANLNVFSLINTSEPSKVNTINVGFDIETLFSFGENLYIGSRSGMYIYSVTNPENPVRLSSVQHFTACDPVVANETHSFITLHSNNNCGNMINILEIYDTTNPNQPLLIHRRNLVAPKGLGLYHNFLIICDDEIKIFDIENPTEPVLVKAIPKACFDVIIDGDELYAIGQNGLYRYTLNQQDITNVTFQSEIIF
ncbi:hypothetical protein J2X31_001181 [Flavobacterium arsenatis]|uniref:LVIVD repeat-containing protein n=1 Tax=Flavobacterium arsenatis TaxID=1484332 RepID=A0ABU1TMI1_9FLAO|nr:hypothetical protein [Flavobacterium arsenatis]MDR6967174.1 hypothetical protein [Flavobacterium arsenatis]